MRGNANLFRDQGIPPIEDWIEYEIMFFYFTNFIVTLLSKQKTPTYQ